VIRGAALRELQSEEINLVSGGDSGGIDYSFAGVDINWNPDGDLEHEGELVGGAVGYVVGRWSGAEVGAAVGGLIGFLIPVPGGLEAGMLVGAYLGGQYGGTGGAVIGQYIGGEIGGHIETSSSPSGSVTVLPLLPAASLDGVNWFDTSHGFVDYNSPVNWNGSAYVPSVPTGPAYHCDCGYCWDDC
jgi:hypothetical protein